MFKGARRPAVRSRHPSARRARQGLRALMAGLALVATPVFATTPSIIIGATYVELVSRYGHNVLGKNAEWGALRLTLDTCPACASKQTETVLIRLPETRVFEDVAPRVVDLDNDGVPEVVVVETDLSKGARLAVYNQTGAIAATPFIGSAFRWLAPLGAADLDGDGRVELAYIDRPHLAKILRVWRYENRTLTEVAETPGLTNHRIGETSISGGIRDCGTGPEIITADAEWLQVMATRLRDGKLTPQALGPYKGPASLITALACN